MKSETVSQHGTMEFRTEIYKKYIYSLHLKISPSPRASFLELHQSCGEFATAKTGGCVGQRVLQVPAVVWPHRCVLNGPFSISAWSVFHMLA